MTKLELLLARADDGQPVLREGLGVETLQGVSRVAPAELPERLWDASGEPHLISRQRWGVVVPEGPEGQRLLELVAPLRTLREEAQGGEPARVYRVRPDMDGPKAARWRRSVLRNEEVAEADRPRYLLVLGDLDQVSLELQQALSTEAYVGRLAFPTDAGYESYVEKVRRWERTPTPAPLPRLLVYTAKDGSDATELGHRLLTGPGVEACRQRQQRGLPPKVEVREHVDEGRGPGAPWLSLAEETVPSVLFSLSHGLGPPKDGWASPAEQRALQGALLLPGGRRLTAEEVASGPFLSGGLWFCFACFSVGTPAQSAYAPWLRTLAGTVPEAARALGSVLLGEGLRPFIAALPQAALANPEGPLAVMGHVDLAWSYSFSDQGRGTPSRFFGVLEALAEGRRVGPALHALLQYLNETQDELAWLYEKEERARKEGKPSPVDEMERAHLWMRRHDLAGYMLLGDPAVHLPLTAR